ncbi:hypothetical protein LCGC14_1092560 [marine sediment metagenome]|uniref:Uncharacterized protein n=1 Tax=marine sediment metagenome TaxID=412755 RepID=A0A0F9PV25_9ZZZZ
MDYIKFKDRFKGRELWRSFNNTLIIGIYSVLIFCFIIFPQYLDRVLLGLAIIIPSYAAFFSYHLREMEREKKGDEVIGDWIEHDHGQGEKYYLPVEDIQPYHRLAEDDIIAVDEYIKMITEQAKQQIKIEVGDKPITPLLTYEEFKKKEQEELERFEKEFEAKKPKEVKKIELKQEEIEVN